MLFEIFQAYVFVTTQMLKISTLRSKESYKSFKTLKSTDCISQQQIKPFLLWDNREKSLLSL